MNYILILSGHENNARFWEKLTANIPSMLSEKVSIICAKDLLRNNGSETSDLHVQIWIKEVLHQAHLYKVNITGEVYCLNSIDDLKKNPLIADCVFFNHNIITPLYETGILNILKGSMISFDSNFELVEHCIVVYDHTIESFKNFKKFFNYFSSAVKNAEVILLVQIGRTLTDASRNKHAVNYIIKLFENVGVITCPAKDFQSEIKRYLSLNDNTLLVTHKSDNNFIFESNFKKQLQNRKIAIYLDEF